MAQKTQPNEQKTSTELYLKLEIELFNNTENVSDFYLNRDRAINAIFITESLFFLINRAAISFDHVDYKDEGEKQNFFLALENISKVGKALATSAFAMIDKLEESEVSNV